MSESQEISTEASKTKRVYSSNFIIDSDMFKLEIANMLRNMSHDDKKPLLLPVEHCHFYRTYCSNGRVQTKSNYVGGHTHEIKVSEDKNGNLKASCTQPIGSKWSEDKHTHKVVYIKSDKVEKRRINAEAQISIANREKI
jgi:hypothetical protein